MDEAPSASRSSPSVQSIRKVFSGRSINAVRPGEMHFCTRLQVNLRLSCDLCSQVSLGVSQKI